MSDRTPNSRYLKWLVNIIGRFKIKHLFETNLDFIGTKMFVTVLFQNTLSTMIQSVSAQTY